MDGMVSQAQTIGTFTVIGDCRHVLGTSDELAAAVTMAKQALTDGRVDSAVIFDDSTGKRTDVDLRGTTEEVLGRLRPQALPEKRSGPGRPKLGVVSREVSLLPRHWDWLNAQPGGASPALRRLVEMASKQNQAQDLLRQQRDAAHAFMWALGADLAGFEEAARALYAGDYAQVGAIATAQAWPEDMRGHLLRLVAHVGRLDALAGAAERGL